MMVARTRAQRTARSNRVRIADRGKKPVPGLTAADRTAHTSCRARAISGPLTPVNSGLSRSLADTPNRRSGYVTGPDGTDSQADSAGSIPVTRSNVKVQVGEGFPNAGPSVV